MIVQLSTCRFRDQFPAFASVTEYSDNTLSLNFETATAYITNKSGFCYGGGLTAAQRTQALYLMTAHLLALAQVVAQGNTPGMVQAATVDKVAVTLTPPPVKNQFQWWMSLTPYGQQLLVLLQMASVGGFYASTAVPGRSGFWFGNGF